MPRLPIDYANTVIYKIVSNDLSITDCYVGHSTDFVRRKQRHKYNCTNEKVYKTIRENGGWDNWMMVEIEKYPCKDANETTAKEREWFERLNSSLNMIYPQRGQAEYLKINRDELIMKKRQYNDDHREEIRLQGLQYRKDRKEEIRNKDHQYHKDHKEEKALYNKERFKKIFICGCGKQFHFNYNSLHKKTVFHKQYMESVMLASDSTIPIATHEFN